MRIRNPVLFVPLLALAASAASAQEARGRSLAFEGMVGPASFVQYFTTDCCGPTRAQSGSSVSLRLRREGRGGVVTGLDGGATFARQRMKWLMGVLSVSGGDTFVPWVQVGTGLVAQPGECPADASDNDPACLTNINLGGQVAAGVRRRVASGLSAGIEAAVVTGAPVYRNRWFTTHRMGITIRVE